MFTTFQDRNLISFSVDAGLTLHDPLPGTRQRRFRRRHRASRGSATARPATTGSCNSTSPYVYTPVRGAETFLEATYQVQVLPSWQLQPDIQYVINPGGGLANPNEPTQTIKNELVIGLRTNITF